MSARVDLQPSGFNPEAAMSLPDAEANQCLPPKGDAFVSEPPPEMTPASASSPYPPEVIAVARRMGVPLGRVTVILSDPSATRALEETTGRRLQERLTPENLARWFASPQGEAWIRKHPGEVAETFGRRAQAGGIAMGIGLLGFLGAEEVADVIGLDPVHHAEERFFFVVSSMHGAERAGSAAWGIAAGRIHGRPFDFIRQSVVREGERAMLEVTFEARASFPRALAAALSANFVVEGSAIRTVANGALAVIRFPVQMLPGMGPGLAASRLVDAALGDLLPRDSSLRHGISLVSFFLPGLYVKLTGGFGVPLMQRVGLGLVGRAFGYGFALDLTTMGLQRLAMGDEAGYQRSVSKRIADHYFDDGMIEQMRAIDALPWYGQAFAYPASFLLFSVREGAAFVAPMSMTDARRMDADPSYEAKVYEEDTRASQEIGKRLPAQLLILLAQGIGSARETAEFYQKMDVGPFQDEIELEGAADDLREEMDFYASSLKSKPEEFQRLTWMSVMAKYRERLGGEEGLWAALAEIQAYQLQQALRTLHFIHLGVNAHIQEIVDADGVVREGKENAFLGLTNPAQSPEEIREAILHLRRVMLAVRIFEAEGEERNRLAALAQEVGLADENGQLVRGDVYYSARAEWAKMAAADPEQKARVDAYRDGLLQEMTASATNPERQMDLAREIFIVTGAAAGVEIALAQEPEVAAEQTLPPELEAERPTAAAEAGSLSFSSIEVVEEADMTELPAAGDWDVAGEGVCEEPIDPWFTPNEPAWIPPPPAATLPAGGAAVFAH